jgi:hypothetical protein
MVKVNKHKEMKRKHSKFEPEPPSSNDIIGLGFDSDSNQLGEHEPYPDEIGPNKSQKPFIELFSTHDDKFDLTGSRRFGYIPEEIEEADDERLESEGAMIRTETYYPDGNKTVVKGDREWVE